MATFYSINYCPKSSYLRRKLKVKRIHHVHEVFHGYYIINSKQLLNLTNKGKRKEISEAFKKYILKKTPHFVANK